MDVTPTPPMFAVMSRLVDLISGEAPPPKEKSTAATNRREHRSDTFDLLHRFVALAMREGVRRYCIENNLPVVAAKNIQVAVADDKPTPLQ